MPKSPVITCDRCHMPLVEPAGQFLRPVMVLCLECKRRTSWYPPKKDIDREDKKADKILSTK